MRSPLVRVLGPSRLVVRCLAWRAPEPSCKSKLTRSTPSLVPRLQELVLILLIPRNLLKARAKFKANWSPFSGWRVTGSSPERDVAVDKDVGGACGGELGLGCGVHVGTAAEMVSDKEDVDVPPWCEG